MRYSTAITDRKYSDIYYKTNKGYFNVSDWLRIYENARNTNVLLNALTGDGIVFSFVAEPLRTDFASVTKLNTLLNNIDLMRSDSVNYLSDVILIASIKHDWLAGWDKDAPKYTDVNTWEKVIETMYLNLADAIGYTPVPNAGSPVRRARCGVAQTGAGLTRNNGFSLYA